MKKSVFFSFSMLLTFSLSMISAYSNAQVDERNSFKKVEKLNGNEMIKRLMSQRYEFNKKIIKSSVVDLSQLPKAEHLFNINGTRTVILDGLEYTFTGDQVTAIKGLNLSKEVLAQITEKLLLLDRIQYYYTEKANSEYYSPNKDLQVIKNIDRLFYSSLRSLLTTTHDIASFTKSENPSLTVETKVAKMIRPNIDKSVEYLSLQSLESLTAK